MGNSNTQRVILTVAISVGILVVWQAFFAPKPSRRSAGQEQVADSGNTGKRVEASQHHDAGAVGAAVRHDASNKGGGGHEETGASSAAQGPVTRSPEGTLTILNAKGAVAQFTDRGAALRSWKLTNKRYTEERGGKLLPVDLVNVEPGTSPWPLVTLFPESDFVVPANAKFQRVAVTKTSVHYRWSSNKVVLDKEFQIDPDRPLVWMTVTLRNRSSRGIRERLKISLFHRQDPNQRKASFTNPYPRIPMVECYVNGKMQRRSATSIRGKGTRFSAAGCGMGKGETAEPGEVYWIGSGDRYFLTAVIPQGGQVQRRCDLKLRNDKANVIEASMIHPEHTLAPGQKKTWQFAVFVGAKTLSELDAVQGPDKVDPKLNKAIEFGWFEVLCRPMVWILQQFYNLVGNWGVAIILLTLVVKLITIYWTHKSMMSMRQMSKLKPEMDHLKEQYADDKQRLNEEMMSLYRKHKVNPLGGCLPMVIQMPVWLALYRTLGNSVELYHSGFVGWITDLTSPDPYYVLPIAMGAAMYAQQAITPQPVDSTQAKLMKYFMPGMFTVMMLALPSGLTLYIFVNTLLTMLHQFYMNKKDPILPAVPTGEQKSQNPGHVAHKERPRPQAEKASQSTAKTTSGRKSRSRRRRRKNK